MTKFYQRSPFNDLQRKRMAHWRQALFQVTLPSQMRCCQCVRQLGPEFVQENRPTGAGGRLQAWYYCAECYLDYNAMCNRPMGDVGVLALMRAMDIDPHYPYQVPSIKVR